MKEFMNTLKQTRNVTGDNVFIGVGYSVLAAVVGVIIVVATLFAKDGGENYAHMGAFMVLLVMCLTAFMDGFIVFPADFMQALSMGKVRKYLVPAHYIMWLWNTFVVLLMALTVSLLEDAVYARLFADVACDIDVKAILCNPLIFVTILLCVPAVILFLGGVTLFFGAKFIWAFVGIYLMGMGFSTLSKMHPDARLVQMLNNLRITSLEMTEVAPVCILCLIAGAVLLAGSWLMLRKQRVTF